MAVHGIPLSDLLNIYDITLFTISNPTILLFQDTKIKMHLQYTGTLQVHFYEVQWTLLVRMLHVCHLISKSNVSTSAKVK